MRDITREEVEGLLGSSITDSMFEEALGYARRKQEYIYQRERREVVMQRWYLVKLAGEYAGNLAFSRFTMDLCRETCIKKYSNGLRGNEKCAWYAGSTHVLQDVLMHQNQNLF